MRDIVTSPNFLLAWMLCQLGWIKLLAGSVCYLRLKKEPQTAPRAGQNNALRHHARRPEDCGINGVTYMTGKWIGHGQARGFLFDDRLYSRAGCPGKLCWGIRNDR
jgi:hypothetical protein